MNNESPAFRKAQAQIANKLYCDGWAPEAHAISGPILQEFAESLRAEWEAEKAPNFQRTLISEPGAVITMFSIKIPDHIKKKIQENFGKGASR